MRYFLLCILLLSACADSAETKIIQVLEARDSSISQKNIGNYASLLSKTYLDGEGSNKLEQMKAIFSRFDSVMMQSQKRNIHFISKETAICEQSYTLKVLAHAEWREIVQREQLTFVLEKQQWKINGGL